MMKGLRGVKSEQREGVNGVEVQGMSEQEGEVRRMDQEDTEQRGKNFVQWPGSDILLNGIW